MSDVKSDSRINTSSRESGYIKYVYVAALLMFSISSVMSQIFSWNEVNELRHRVDQFSGAVLQTNAKEDCLFLYRNDVTTALGAAIAANNSLWVSVATRSPAVTPEEQTAQAADNARLGHELEASNQPLIDAVAALNEYDRLDPAPNKCPHPAAVAVRNSIDRDE